MFKSTIHPNPESGGRFDWGTPESSHLWMAVLPAFFLHALVLLVAHHLSVDVKVQQAVDMIYVEKLTAQVPSPAPVEPLKSVHPAKVESMPARVEPANIVDRPKATQPETSKADNSPQPVTVPVLPSTISSGQAKAGLGVPVVSPSTPAKTAEMPRNAPAVTSGATYRPGQQVSPSDNSVTIRSGYQELLMSHIEKRKEYPLFARKAKLEGICLIRCELEMDGSIKNVSVVRSSGHAQLDAAAVRSVKNVGQFPPVPRELKWNALSFDVPIKFMLSSY